MPFAKQIGQRMLTRRVALGMSQQQIGSQLRRPVTRTQIGRYEKGVDYISASRLNEIAIMMGVSPGSLFPPVRDGAGADTNTNGVVTTEELTKLLKDPYAIRLLRAFATIRGKKFRAQVIDWIEAFATRHATTGWSRYKQVGL
jgi:transcriptional regulator with XRE-family HTH domain